MGSGRQRLGSRWGPILGRRGLKRPFFAFSQSGHLPRGHSHQTARDCEEPSVLSPTLGPLGSEATGWGLSATGQTRDGVSL